MILNLLEDTFSIVKLKPSESIPSWALSGKYYFISKTDEELSIVCPSQLIPDGDFTIESNWSCLKVAGPLEFSLTGILASIATPLAEAKLSLFAISTFDTDYILVKKENIEQAIQTLTLAGFQIK